MPKVIPIKLTIDNREAKREADEVKKKVEDIGDEAKKAGKKVDKEFTTGFAGAKKAILSAKQALGGLVALVTTGFAAKMANDMLLAADSINKTADKLGLTTDRLQEYRFAASQAGIDSRRFDMSFQRFGRRIAEVANEQGELLKTAEQYGLQVKTNEGRLRDINAVFYDYANLIKNASSDQEALRLAFKAFDSEGAVMVTMLRKGGAGVEEMTKKARELGIVIGKDVLDTSTKLVDKFDILKKSMSATFTKVVVDNATLIEKAMRGIAWAAEKLGKGAGLRSVMETVSEFSKLQRGGYTGLFGIDQFLEMGLYERQQYVDDIKKYMIRQSEGPAFPPKGRSPQEFAKKGEVIPRGPRPESYQEQLRREQEEQEAFVARMVELDKELAYQSEKETRVRTENSQAIIQQIAKQRDEVEKDRAAWEAMTGANIKSSHEWVDQYADVRDKFVSYSQDMSNAFVDFAFTGKQSVREMIDSIIQDFARFAAQKYLFGPLFQAAGNAMFGAPIATQHAGGNYYQANMRGRLPVFHNGLRSNEYPAILEKGEEVRTKEQVRGGGEPRVEVIIMKGSQPETQTQERRSSQGVRQLLVMVGQDIANMGVVGSSILNTFNTSLKGRRV